MCNPFACLLTGCSLLAASHCLAQAGPPPATYTYTAYTVLDRTAPDSLTVVPNVGGTLTLQADGSYQKSLSILFPAGPRYFAQNGRVSYAFPDSIAFAFTDLKGPDNQRGTYRYDVPTRHLTIVLAGYPPGNEGRYELLGPEPAQGAEFTGAINDDGSIRGGLPRKQARPKKPIKPNRPRTRR